MNGGAQVVFAGPIYISGLTNVTISGNGEAGLTYGFLSTNKSDVFQVQGKCSGLRIYNFDNTGVGLFFDASGSGLAVYNGTPSTKLLLNTALGNIRLISSGLLLQGSYGACTDFKNVIDSIAIFNVIITNTTSTGQEVAGASIYHLDAHDWTVVGPCPNGKTDVGIVQINGNARVHNINRNGGYGYVMRIINVGLDGVSESYLYNCIDINSWQYGTIDTRVDPGQFIGGTTVPFCIGGNIHILNNTTGNKTQADNYTTVLAIVGSFTGYKCEIRNNLSFNTFQIQANKMIQMNASDPMPDTSNNQYYTSAQIGAVLVDQVNCFLTPNSPAIDKGVASSLVTTDIAGVSRPQGKATDVGARELVQSVTPPPPVIPDSVFVNAGPAQTITLPTIGTTLSGTATSSQGTITSTTWSEVSGPSQATFANSASASTGVTGLTVGSYLFQFTATDSKGVKASALVSVNGVMSVQQTCPPPAPPCPAPRTVLSLQLGVVNGSLVVTGILYSDGATK